MAFRKSLILKRLLTYQHCVWPIFLQHPSLSPNFVVRSQNGALERVTAPSADTRQEATKVADVQRSPREVKMKPLWTRMWGR